MVEPISNKEALVVVRRTYQEVIDTLLFISDEVEMNRMPARDPASAIRLAAGILALTKDLT